MKNPLLCVFLLIPCFVFAAIDHHDDIVLEAPIEIGSDGAYVDCPCVQPQGVFNGNYCHNWWSTLAPVCTGAKDSNISAACYSKWCYVNPDVCSTRRKIFESWGNQAPGSHYSLATCGSVPAHELLNKDKFVGKRFKIFSFGIPVSKYIGPDFAHPGLVSALRVAGHVFEQLSIKEENLVYMEISQEAKELHGSLYTACVWDVVIGNLDICLGDFWDTAERREMGARFSGLVFSEYIYLYGVKKETKRDAFSTFLHMLYTPLEPFAPSLWGTIVLVAVCVGAAMWFFDRGRPGNDDAFYLSVLSFTNSSLAYDPKSASGKIFAIGVSFFILVTLASFTANLATFLIRGAAETSVRDIGDAFNRQSNVCIVPGLRPTVDLRYSAARHLGVSTDSTGNSAFGQLEDGSCDYALLQQITVQGKWGEEKNCDLKEIGDPEFIEPTGFYMRNDILYEIGLLVARFRTSAEWHDIESSAIAENQCGPGDEECEGACQLEAEHMLGTVLLLVLSFGVAVIVFIFEKMSTSKSAKRLTEVARKRISQRGFPGNSRGRTDTDINGTCSIVPPLCQNQPEKLERALRAALAESLRYMEEAQQS